LFAGIGGLELGLRRAGHATLMLCEVDEFAQRVLLQRFPEAQLKADVRELKSLPPDTELLTAGFPCQDLSQAGRTAGIDGVHSGLVRVVFELLQRKRVKWLLLENVPNMLRLDRGAAMTRVVEELERLGYRWAYRVVDSRAFGLPQRRLRVYLLASREGDPRDVVFADDALDRVTESRPAHAYGFYWTEGNRGLGWTANGVPTLKGGSGVGIPSPPALWYVKRSPTRAFVVPTIEEAEQLQGFEAGWTSVVDERGGRPRWKLVGNAVSVPVAQWLGTRLVDPGVYDVGRDIRLSSDAGWPSAAYGGPRQIRRGVAISTMPEHAELRALSQFIRGVPLSHRAAAGFLSRLQRSSLRRPAEFDQALEEYVRRPAADATGTRSGRSRAVACHI
jgi:DNA (cytosine-5)-methyltransferase 1